MQAEIDLDEFKNAVAKVTKGVRGKHIQARARALLAFQSGGVSIEFNNRTETFRGHVSKTGTYSLNPFVLRKLLDTYNGPNLSVNIEADGIVIGRTRTGHVSVRGSLHEPEAKVVASKIRQELRVKRREERLAREATREAAERSCPVDELARAGHVAYRRTDGGIEYSAAILEYEKGATRNRRVHVQTTDSLRVWIHEFQIVSYGKDPKLPEME